MHEIEIGLGVSEATEAQLGAVQDLLSRRMGLAIHADHADGSVHPKFARDAFASLASIGHGYTAPCDLHLYMRKEGDAARTVQEFHRCVPTGRNVHLALEGVESAEAALRLADAAMDAGFTVVPSIQTDPLTDHGLHALNALLSSASIRSVNILTAGKEVSASNAARAVVDLYSQLVGEHRTLHLFLDRNCSPERVRYIAQEAPIHAVVSGAFIWSSSDPLQAVDSLRSAARVE